MSANSASDAAEMLYCKSHKSDAKGRYLEDGLIVYKGSKVAKELAASAGPVGTARDKLLASAILEEKDGAIYFSSDHVLNSPSAASSIVLGRRSNGWADWKDSKGKTLDELKRRDSGVEVEASLKE